MWNYTQREIMLRSGQCEKRRDTSEETARRTQRRRRRRIDLRARARRRGCCDRCEEDARGGEEKERANDRTARLSPLKQFVSAVHRNWSGNTAATVSNTLRSCVLSRIPCSSLSIPLSTDSTTFVVTTTTTAAVLALPLWPYGHLWYVVEDSDDYERDDLSGSWSSMGFCDYGRN